MKVVLIGAGSFVFAPSLMYDAIFEHRLEGSHLALVDPVVEMAEQMAGLGRHMARQAHLKITVTAHADRKRVLDGADFVIFCAAEQLQRRFAMDVEIIHRLAPGHLVTEFGGIHGLSYSVRQIALVQEVVRDMLKHCPSAWLLCASNPLPRVCQAAHELGLHTAGFCSNSQGQYELIGKLFLGHEERFPWTEAVRKYAAITAGLNHFTFTLALLERDTGRDVLSDFIARIRRQTTLEPLTDFLISETGYWPANGDAHMRDFMPPDHTRWPLELSSHGTAAEREIRLQTLRAAAAGTGPWEPLLAHRAWEKPVDFIAGLSGGQTTIFHSLNLVNQGQLPDMACGVFVETPAQVTSRGPAPQTIRLPPSVAHLSRPVAEIHALIVQGALRRQKKLLYSAIELDPTILDKTAGRTALDACLDAHAGLIGRF